MSNFWIKNYPVVSDLNSENLYENNSLKKMLALIGTGKRVVDFGCASGYFAQLLNKAGCTVVGVEINPSAAKVAQQYCESVVVADLDFVHLNEILPTDRFDVVVFGDVLEHLRDPWRILEEAHQILNPGGSIVASIPNIAHGAVRLSLLQGNFEYTKLGILDNTHLRFFTCKTVESLFEETGYFLESIDRTRCQIFSDSSVCPNVNRQDFDSQLIAQIEQDSESETLQFVVRAFPKSWEGRCSALQTENESLIHQLSEIQANFKQIQQNSADLQSELHHTQSELHHTQSELHHTQSELHHTQSELESAQLTITAMQSSKFWRLRRTWLSLKGAFGL